MRKKKTEDIDMTIQSQVLAVHVFTTLLYILQRDKRITSINILSSNKELIIDSIWEKPVIFLITINPGGTLPSQ